MRAVTILTILEGATRRLRKEIASLSFCSRKRRGICRRWYVAEFLMITDERQGVESKAGKAMLIRDGGSFGQQIQSCACKLHSIPR